MPDAVEALDRYACSFGDQGVLEHLARDLLARAAKSGDDTVGKKN